MKIVLLAAAFAAAASASAGLGPSSANSVRDVPPAEPAFKLDLRLRDARGGVRSDLLQQWAEGKGALRLESPSLHDAPAPTSRPWLSPYPKPITPQGDGEVYALHGPRGPQMLRIAPMPMVVVDGVDIDPKMPMKTPDPAVDYKLHIRDQAPLEPDAAPKK